LLGMIAWGRRDALRIRGGEGPSFVDHSIGKTGYSPSCGGIGEYYARQRGGPYTVAYREGVSSRRWQYKKKERKWSADMIRGGGEGRVCGRGGGVLPKRGWSRGWSDSNIREKKKKGRSLPLPKKINTLRPGY